MSPLTASSLRAAERRLGLWWAISFATVLVVPAIGWAVLEVGSMGLGGDDPGRFRTFLHVCAIGLAAASVLVRCWLLSDRRLYAFLRRPVPSPAGRGGPRSARERKLLALAGWIAPAFLLGWIANAAIVLLGLALVLISADLSDMTPFVFIAFVLELLSIPRMEPYALRAAGMADA